jgi:hypothetical protein
MGVGQSYPVPYHLRPEKLFFAGIRDVMRFGKIYPSITDVNAQAIGEQDKKQRDEQIDKPMGSLDGQFYLPREKAPCLDRAGPGKQSQQGRNRQNEYRRQK